TRYSIAIDATQTTAPDEWRVQSPGNRQGSSGMLDSETGSRLSQEETELQNLARKIYEDRLEHGVAREQARKDLPLSTYTEAYWKVDLHNMFHFLSLRMDDHSQYEIRCYAKTIGDEIVRRWCPIAWEAFVDYGLQRMGLTGLEIPVVQALASGDTEGALKMAEEHGWLKTGKKGFLRNRERSEFEDKLRRLNFSIPWEPSAPIA
nr:FAD-dependent thymidylate synthase [Candidatus Krumholzibacteriota bacterium]